MMLRSILAVKGDRVYSTTPDATLEDVAQALVKHNCGSLVVCDPQDSRRMVGIVTERDILRACAARRPLAEVRVAEAMTSEVIVAHPHDPIDDTMGLMTENRIRHLPIVDDDRLVGIISIGDVVKAKHDELSVENHYLISYIRG